MGIVAAVLAVALVGTLGYVFYQNFIAKKTNTVSNVASNNNDSKSSDKKGTVTEPTPPATPTYNTYSDNNYSFRYPLTGWAATKDGSCDPQGSASTVSISTSDYQSGPVGPEAGSCILIKISDITDPGQRYIYYKNKNMISNDSMLKVDGQTAYRYQFTYEFGFYDTLLSKNGKTYEIVLNGPTVNSLKVYDDVLGSINIK